MNEKRDIDQLSNEQLGAMYAPKPYRETDPMEARNKFGNLILAIGLGGFILWLLFGMILH